MIDRSILTHLTHFSPRGSNIENTILGWFKRTLQTFAVLYTAESQDNTRWLVQTVDTFFCAACVASPNAAAHTRLTSVMPEFHACTQMEDTILVRCKRGTDVNVIINFVQDRGPNLHRSSTTAHPRGSREETMLGTDAQGATIEGNAITHSSQTQGCELWGMVDQGRMIKIGDVATLLEIDCDEVSTKSR